ncbi:MAG: single-stranded-DNA-specific exonuclease RecJ [Candidatus Glassbacteria bacterium]|nr:single-stranded-DNA-specific exonuclease RecJ [Candidatus Glassbacteria bacterium]
MQYRWVSPQVMDADKVRLVQEKFGLHPLVCQILSNRGFQDVEQVERFLKPSLDHLHDPFIMKGMEPAVDRLARALANREKIVIYGDYDVDGITSISLIVRYLRELGGDVGYYIPHRMVQGYGLSPAAIDSVAEMGASLVVTVDCGITAVEAIDYAKSIGLEMVVTDHHEAAEELPAAVAILNPKQAGDNYPEKELAGIGVAFKLCQGLSMKLGYEVEPLFEHLDLVAVGSIADIVPLLGENRVFAKFGLEKLRSSSKPGIQALIDSSGLKNKSLSSGQVVFSMAPRINAVGRMGDAVRGVKLFLTDDMGEACRLAQILEKENRYRREVDNQTLLEARQQINYHLDLDSRCTVVLSSEDWHPGVLGIVASRIVEEYYRPTVLISFDEEGEGKGSARSISNFHLFEALKQCAHCLDVFGGHKYAAGLQLRREDYEEFVEAFERAASSMLEPEDLVPEISVDLEISLSQADKTLLESMDQFRPYGPGNPKPVLVANDLSVVGYPKVVGNNHLKMRVRKDGYQLDTIGFGLADKLKEINTTREKISMAFVLEENEWNNMRNLQARIKDIKVSE